MERKIYSVIEFIQYLKDRPYMKISINSLWSRIKLEEDRRNMRFSLYHKIGG